MSATTQCMDTDVPNTSPSAEDSRTHWLEFHLVDESGEPLANLPWRARSQATRYKRIPAYSGMTDAEGFIRLQGLLPLDLTLSMDADALAAVLQQRKLRPLRAEPPMPRLDDPESPYGPQRSGFSPVEEQALQAGHSWHYLRIGQLCDRLPTLEPAWDQRELPAFHFPDHKFGGMTISCEEFDRRHVLEVCPFRAWSLMLHHQPEYSLTNAYNLGLMSTLAYEKSLATTPGSVMDFFMRQCLDMSRTPRVGHGDAAEPCVVRDVPFDQRYYAVTVLGTYREPRSRGMLQLFTATSASQMLVSWRGTSFEKISVADLYSEFSLRLSDMKVPSNCEPALSNESPAVSGGVHLGFREAFNLMRLLCKPEQLRRLVRDASARDLFICGHSVGGALALIHAASLKACDPLLYTYGAPKAFTFKAMKTLQRIKHFRHVNSTDLIPGLPAEPELDDYLYRRYGPAGSVFGVMWTMLRDGTSALTVFADLYCHHGDVVAFHKVEQHALDDDLSAQAGRSNAGLVRRHFTKIKGRLPATAKLYLVPSTDLDAATLSGDKQQSLITSLDVNTRAQYFPPYAHVRGQRPADLSNHPMLEYQSYIRGHLLHSIDPDRNPPLKDQVALAAFVKQMSNSQPKTPQSQYQHNDLLLDMHRKTAKALEVTRLAEGGEQALARFNALATQAQLRMDAVGDADEQGQLSDVLEKSASETES